MRVRVSGRAARCLAALRARVSAPFPGFAFVGLGVDAVAGFFPVGFAFAGPGFAGAVAAGRTAAAAPPA